MTDARAGRRAAVAEMARVLAPGGRMSVFDFDWRPGLRLTVQGDDADDRADILRRDEERLDRAAMPACSDRMASRTSW